MDERRRLKVLWLIRGLGPGGAERLLVVHAAHSNNDRFEYSVGYFVPGKDQLVEELQKHRVNSTLLGSGRTVDLRWLWRLRSHLRSNQFDVVHAHAPLPAAAVRLLCYTLRPSLRPKLVYTEHNEWGKHRRTTRWLNRATIRGAGTVLAVSQGVAASMSGARKVEILHHGVSIKDVVKTADRDGVRSELGLVAGSFVIGIAANLRWEKGYDVLLQAARIMLDEGIDVWFISIGQGPLEEELHKLHEQLGLGDRFRFLGYRSDPTRVMSGFDTMCLASRHEGLPVVLMEAAALGIPVVATSVGGIPEVVDTGSLVQPENAGALAAKLADRASHTVPMQLSAESAIERQEEIYSGSS